MDRVKSRNGYLDLSATAFKKAFGQSLEHAFRGARIRISRHGRVDERVVILREAELKELEGRARSPLELLRAEFDGLVEKMQSDRGRDAAAAIGTASTQELGEAAVKGFTARD